jgi:hypothetical protein
VRKARIGLLVAFGVALVGATVPWWMNGDWTLLSPAGLQVLHSDALRVYVDTPGLQAGPLALPLIGVISLAGNFIGPILAHLCLWLIGIAIAMVAASTARFEPNKSPSRAAPDLVQVQPGVLALVAALPVLVFLLNDGFVSRTLALALTITVLGLLWLRHSARAGSAHSLSMPRSVWIVLLAIGPWSALASIWTHLDDGLALLAMAGALFGAARGYRWASAVAVGVAIAFKPWAIAALPLVWRPGDRRGVCRDLALALMVPAACWAPFILAARGTLGAASRPFPVSPESTMYWLGLHDHTAPAWQRTAQLALIVICAALALRRSPADALAVGLIARLAFDPSIYDYYAAGAIAFVAVADIVNHRAAWRTCLAIVGLWFSPYLADSVFSLALLRSVTLAVLLAAGIMPVLLDDAARSRLLSRRPWSYWSAGASLTR